MKGKEPRTIIIDDPHVPEVVTEAERDRVREWWTRTVAQLPPGAVVVIGGPVKLQWPIE